MPLACPLGQKWTSSVNQTQSNGAMWANGRLRSSFYCRPMENYVANLNSVRSEEQLHHVSIARTP